MFAYGVLARIIEASPDKPSYLLIGIGSVLAAVLALCLLGALSAKRGCQAFGTTFVAVCTLCTGVGLAFVLWMWSRGEIANFAWLWFGAGSLLISIGSAGLFFCWGVTFARGGGRTILMEVGVGFFAALVMLVPYNALSLPLQAFLLFLACALDALFLVHARSNAVKGEGGQSASDVDVSDAKWIRRRMYAGMVCYGVAMGLSSSLLGHTGQATYLDESIVRLLCGVVVLAVSFLVARLSRREPVLLLYRLAYLIIALNIVVLVLFPHNSQLLLAILFIGHLLILAICMFLLFRTAYYLIEDRGRIVAFGVAAFLSGDLLVRGIHDFLAAMGAVPQSSLSFAFTVALVSVVIIAYSVVFSERDIERMDALVKGDGSSGSERGAPFVAYESYADVALGRYGLTPREFEIVSLLLLGRSSPRIQSELFISESTVHTHTRHIYSKMSIHSRQELIDLAKQWSEEQRC